MIDRIQRLRAYSENCRRDVTYQGPAILLATMIIFVGVFDFVSTNAALAAGNLESNPLVKFFQQQWGAMWLIPKLTIHIALAVMVLWLPSRRMIWNARGGILLYAAIIASNFHVADWKMYYQNGFAVHAEEPQSPPRRAP
jgi:hypothetical protein